MNCQEMEEILGAYALDALSKEERQAADSHLATCEKCPATLQQLQAIVDLFPLSVPPVEPAPRVKEQIIARIQEHEMSQRLSPPPPTPLRRSIRPLRWRSALLIASILLLLVLAGASFLWNLSLLQQLALRGAPPVVYQLHGTADAAQATGQVVYYPQQNVTLLLLRNLPPLTGTQVYQGWLIRGKQPTSIGLFNVHNGVATLDFQGNLNGFDVAAVSLEQGPEASKNAPQGPVVAQGTLTKT